MKQERRFCTHGMKVERREDAPAKIVGYAAVFGRSSVELWGFTEEVAPGAFVRSIREDDPVALFDHDTGKPLGRQSAGTLRLSEDDIGLRMEIDAPNTSLGNDLVELISRGDVKGASFGFETITDEWNTKDGMPHRKLLEVKLYDVSPVMFPAYPDTSVAMRACEEWQKRTAPDFVRFYRQKRAEIA
jgi:hypothetical protein